MSDEIVCCKEPSLEYLGADVHHDENWREMIVDIYWCQNCGTQHAQGGFIPDDDDEELSK